MGRFLIYNFSGELDEISHLFPNERLARIAAIVRAEGGDAVIIDRANFDDLEAFGSDFMRTLGGLGFDESKADYARVVKEEAERIAAEGFDTIFPNLWHGTGFKFTLDMLAILKDLRPGMRAFGIGQKVDWFREHILDLSGPCLDGLVSGLGFDAVAGIVENRPLTEIPNLILRDGDGFLSTERRVIDVDAFAGPIYEEAVYRNIGAKVPVFSTMLSNQACANQCAFCVRPQNYGRSIRERDVGGVHREIERMYREHGCTHFRLEDSTPPKHALTDLARAILDGPLNGLVTLSAFCRADPRTEEDFEVMRAAGFLSLFFGVESLHDATLQRLRKGITFETVRSTLERAHAAGIRTVGSFIFPTPGETRESMETTLRRIEELRGCLDSVLVVPAGVHPTSEWGTHPEKFGIETDADYVKESIIYPIKYEVPMRHWKPFPFRYGFMGRSANEVAFHDMVSVHEEFVKRVRDDIGIPRVPDYYFLVSHLIAGDPAAVWSEIVRCIMERDYSALRRLLLGVAPAQT